MAENKDGSYTLDDSDLQGSIYGPLVAEDRKPPQDQKQPNRCPNCGAEE